MKLFCFTYAGGNSTFFDLVEQEAKDYVDVVKLDYAGHGQRRKEPFYQDFTQLAEDMYALLKSKLSGQESYALFGYSMGAIAAVEVLQKILWSKEIPRPLHVFLAAHEPETKAELSNYDSGELDDFVKLRTIQFGAVPEKLIANNSFWRVYLPIFRADYSIIGKYKFEELQLKTDVSATVFYSETDTPYRTMEQWKNYFIGDCQFYHYTGNHFFINEHGKELVEMMKRRLNV